MKEHEDIYMAVVEMHTLDGASTSTSDETDMWLY